MGTPYPLEKKNQILGRIISKEITVEQAHSETNKLSVIDVGSSSIQGQLEFASLITDSADAKYFPLLNATVSCSGDGLFSSCARRTSASTVIADTGRPYISEHCLRFRQTVSTDLSNPPAI